jgi:hypothetical protein
MDDPRRALERLLDERLDRRIDRRIVGDLVEPGTVALVLYGSRLSPRVAAADSELDFFQVAERLSSAAHAFLPPSVYHRVAAGEPCKLSVLSSAQLARETSPEAADLYHLGRFSKPLGLVYARDAGARAQVLAAQLSSLTTLAPHALALCPGDATVDEFSLTLLGLSYLAEPRVAEPKKVRALFDADPAHHRAVAELLLSPAWGFRADSRATAQLIARSRRRALLRWPKLLLTFDGWLDYLLRKVERHHGRRIALTPNQRRHPLLFGWSTLRDLRREGLVR